VSAARTDPKAFGVLFDRYWETIFRFCYFRLDDWHEAEDVASQIFSNAFTSLSRFHTDDPVQTFRAWLYGIARNLLGHTWRYASRHPSTSIETAFHLPDAGESIEDRVVRGEEQELLFALMAGLLPDQRELLELRLAGLSASEIGVVLGRTPDAVRKAQSRIFSAMRAAAADATTRESGRHNG
jgi:RNA polymerase sigma-70 factor (ECF subfamily)